MTTTMERIDKPRRLLIEGRLTVHKVEVDRGMVYAECKGDSGSVYKLGWNADEQRWGCSCPARTTCAHLRALWLVASR